MVEKQNCEEICSPGTKVINMEENEKIECHVCGSELAFDGFDGDWKRFECESKDCGANLRRPIVSNPSDGFSMEDLTNISDYVD